MKQENFPHDNLCAIDQDQSEPIRSVQSDPLHARDGDGIEGRPIWWSQPDPHIMWWTNNMGQYWEGEREALNELIQNIWSECQMSLTTDVQDRPNLTS